MDEEERLLQNSSGDESSNKKVVSSVGKVSEKETKGLKGGSVDLPCSEAPSAAFERSSEAERLNTETYAARSQSTNVLDRFVKG